MYRTPQSTMRQTWPTRIPVDDLWLVGDLAVPPDAIGLVVFAHGSGSSRLSPRNQQVANLLNARRLGTLLVDLLSEGEEATDRRTAHLRFDVEMLAYRLVCIAEWTRRDEQLRHLPIGLFGASTGAGAALIAAALKPDVVRAVVSRGGRPDLAGSALARVLAPTLLIVGERDELVVQLNREAMAQMHAEVRLEIVPGATHLFEESGTLDRAAALAGDWFVRHL